MPVAMEDTTVEMTDATSPLKKVIDATSPSKIEVTDAASPANIEVTSGSPAKIEVTSGEEITSGDKVTSGEKETDAATEAKIHLAQGKRHLVVKDIKPAVDSLEKACATFAEAFGETADECGEAYYFYGSALLELSRLETGDLVVLGAGVGETDEASEDEETSASEDEQGESKMEETKDAEEKKEIKDDAEKKETNDDAQKKEIKDDAEKKETKDDAEKKETADDAEKKEIKDEDMESTEHAEEEEADVEVEAVPAEDEEITHLQLAWEVLELAKNIFYRQTKKCKDIENKLSESYLKLGEVSLESENYKQAIEDLCQCLFIRQKNLSPDNRKIAEVHYQLGNCYSFDKQYMQGKVQYDLALKVLTGRVEKLKEAIAARKDGKQAPVDDKTDTFYTEEGEIEEIKQIIAEFDDKIVDLGDVEKEAEIPAAVSPRLAAAIRNNARAVSSLALEGADNAEGKILDFGESSSNGGSSEMETDAAAAKTSPAAKDISHLVKRKADSLNGEGDSSPKAAAVDKSPIVKKVKVAEEKVVSNGTTNGVAVNGK